MAPVIPSLRSNLVIVMSLIGFSPSAENTSPSSLVRSSHRLRSSATAGGDSGKIERAHGVFKNVGWGFVLLLVAVVVLVGALTFVPAFVLGPISEQLQLLSPGGAP